MNYYIVPINETEFSTLLVYGEIKAPMNRLIEVPLSSEVPARPELDKIRKKQIIQAICSHIPDDAVSILFLLLKIDNESRSCFDGNFPSFSINQVECVYPFTSNVILESRYPNIKFSDPLFSEKIIQEIKCEILKKEGIEGAESLIHAIVSDASLPGNLDFKPLIEHASRWVQLKVTGYKPDSTEKSLVVHSLLFDYNHNRLTPKLLNKPCIGLGIILNENLYLPEDMRAPYRDLLGSFKQDNAFLDLLRDPRFLEWSKNVKDKIDAPVSMRAIVLFLEWSLPSQKAKRPNINIIYNQVKKDLNSMLEPEEIIQALWLFGFYWGLSEFITLKYNSANCAILKTPKPDYEPVILQPYKPAETRNRKTDLEVLKKDEPATNEKGKIPDGENESSTDNPDKSKAIPSSLAIEENKERKAGKEETMKVVKITPVSSHRADTDSTGNGKSKEKDNLQGDDTKRKKKDDDGKPKTSTEVKLEPEEIEPLVEKGIKPTTDTLKSPSVPEDATTGNEDVCTVTNKEPAITETSSTKTRTENNSNVLAAENESEKKKAQLEFSLNNENSLPKVN